MSELLRVYAPDECDEKDGYPYAWHRSIKSLVREQAGNRCLRCKHPYEKGDGEWSACDEHCDHDGPIRVSFLDGGDDWEPVLMDHPSTWTSPKNKNVRRVEARWRILTVHHLGEKRDCRWFMLTTLCQRCHLTIQGRVVMDRAFILEHSPWFKIFAAGWYAWKYENREIGRDEASARLDELLDYERLA